MLAETDPTQISTKSDLPPRAHGVSYLWWLLLVAIVAAALCLPFLRTIYWLGDEGVLLHGAARILDGKRLYADFFEFLPPGGFVLTAIWFKIAGISIVSARSLAILTIVGIACFAYLTCQFTSRKAPLAALFAIGWVVSSQGGWTVVEHQWFTTLFSMITAWAALVSVEHQPRRLRWPMMAGAAAGLAAMVTPTRGAFAMLAALLAFLHPRQRPTGLIVYLIGCALAPLGLLSFVVSTHAVLPAFDDVIRFTAEQYSSIQWVPFAYWVGNQNYPHQHYPLTFVFPAAALLLAIMYVFGWRISLCDRRLQLCSAFAFAGFLGCFPRPDMVHISFTAPLALPLVVLCITQLAQRLRPILRYAALGIMIVLAVPSTLAFLSIRKEALEAKLMWTPRGRAVLAVRGLPELLQQIAATPHGEAYFFYPYMPMMPFLTARNSVAPYDIFVPDYTLPSQYQNACVSVMEHASWIVIDREWADPKVLPIIFPAIRNVRPSEVSRFEQTLDSGFERVARYGSLELLHRRSAGADPSRCNDIAE